MYNFFITEDKIKDGKVIITDANFNHVKNVLRMREGETFLVSVNKQSHLCKIENITNDSVVAVITDYDFNDTSLPIKIDLYQALPKSDKLELVIQKAVELGAEAIYPVQTERCVVKLDEKKAKSKVERWNSIAESAAKQCKRAFIPSVNAPLSFAQTVDKICEYDLFLVAYENEQGALSTKTALDKIKCNMKIAVLIGSEGGLSEKEVDALKNNGAITISLGKRILRTETASITSLSILMMHAEMNL